MKEVVSNNKEKECAKCGILFSCMAIEGYCWCNNYHLTKDQLKELQERYNSCLCEKCIEKISREVN